MNHDKNLLQQIDACRPGSDDLNLPELGQLALRVEIDPVDRRLYERVQQLDASLQAALDDVPVPADLAERLLARLQVAPKQPASTRRRWLAAAVGFLAVAASLTGVVFVLHRPEPLTGANLVHRAVDFYHDDQPGETWPAAKAPLSSSTKVHLPRGAVWRNIVGFPGQRGAKTIAYELNLNSVMATLYVAQKQVPGLPAAPPSVPQRDTAGLAASAWQEGAFLYVLVVQGNSTAYRTFIKTPKFA